MCHIVPIKGNVRVYLESEVHFSYCGMLRTVAPEVVLFVYCFMKRRMLKRASDICFATYMQSLSEKQLTIEKKGSVQNRIVTQKGVIGARP